MQSWVKKQKMEKYVLSSARKVDYVPLETFDLYPLFPGHGGGVETFFNCSYYFGFTAKELLSV